MHTKSGKHTICLILTVMMALSLFTGAIPALATTADQQTEYTIANPYTNVNWVTTGQYKAAHHTHSTFSDGSNFRRDMLFDKYAKNFDIVAMTDHDTTTTAWDKWTAAGSWNNNWNNIGLNMDTVLTAEELAAINAGTFNKVNPSLGTYNGNRTNNNGMISMGESNETSAEGERFNGGGSNFQNHHINAFFMTGLPGNAGQDRNDPTDPGRTMAEVLQAIENTGGISHFNHPGRYTGGQNNAARSSDPAIVGKYVDLFMTYPSCVGMEIINKWDGESVNDRILWDNILMQTMPQGRGVWGFSNDDSHSLSGNGHAWNVMLMPTLSQAGTKASMQTGAFYGVSRIDRQHGVNGDFTGSTPGAPAQTTTAETMYSGGTNNDMALGFLAQDPTPSISNIVVIGNTITITGAGYNDIIWYSGVENNASKEVATGNSIDVSLYAELAVNGYVRAELVGKAGVAYTQPFGVSKVEIPVETTLSLSLNAHSLSAGQDLSVATTFDKEVNSNVAKLTYTFSDDMFSYKGFEAAAGVVILNEEIESGKVIVTVMIANYNTQDYGNFKLSAKKDIKTTFTVSLFNELVVKTESGLKETKTYMASVTSDPFDDGRIPGDFNGDGKVDLLDLSEMIDAFGATASHPNWAQKYRYMDFNQNGEVDIFDIVLLARHIFDSSIELPKIGGVTEPAGPTEGTMTFLVDIDLTGLANYAPAHYGAIWVEDANGRFVKTLRQWGAGSYIRHLLQWNVATPDRDRVDAVTSATVRNNVTFTNIWNCTDVNGNVVPDGEYIIRAEFTTRNGQGPLMAAAFTKGAEAQSLTPADLVNFKNIKIDYLPK